MPTCPACQSPEAATLPMIHQAGVHHTTHRSIGGFLKSSTTTSALAQSVAPPKLPSAALIVMGVIVTGVGICCLAESAVFGGTLAVVGIPCVVGGRYQQRTRHAHAMSVWESTWCCRACGKRWT